jgi:putative membrane protein insertion efficiency factor
MRDCISAKKVLRDNDMKFLVLLLIKFYQTVISPVLPPLCRFTPSCSAYAYEAIELNGLFKGSFLAFKRIIRCHPFCEGGIDPVPLINNNSRLSLKSDRIKKEK